MRIAVACKGLQVAPCFGQVESYLCYTVDHGVVVGCHNMLAGDKPLSEIVAVFKELNISTVIVDSIELSAAQHFCECGIEVVAGVSGGPREVTDKYLTKTLIGIDDMCGALSNEDDLG